MPLSPKPETSEDQTAKAVDRFDLATHPHEVEAWLGACEAQILLTDTDPQDALDEIEENANERLNFNTLTLMSGSLHPIVLPLQPPEANPSPRLGTSSIVGGVYDGAEFQYRLNPDGSSPAHLLFPIDGDKPLWDSCAIMERCPSNIRHFPVLYRDTGQRCKVPEWFERMAFEEVSDRLRQNVQRSDRP